MAAGWDAPSAEEVLSSIPSPPRTPSDRARRLLFRYAGRQLAMLWIGGIFLALGSVFAVVFCWGLPADLAISLSGRKVRGSVVEARLNTTVRINRRHPVRIRFAYEIDGEPHEASSNTLDPALVALRPGSPVEVEVSTLNPAWARLEGLTYSPFGYFTAFVLIFPVGGAIVLCYAIRSNRREIRAYTYGVPAVGRVVFAGMDTSVRINRRHPFKVGWEFRVDDRVYSGSLSSMQMTDLEMFMRAQFVPVLYDPAKPQINTIYVG